MTLPHVDSPSERSPESLSATAADQPIQKSFSCVICSQRKVKCDRRPGGCANCTKARIVCIYKAPPPPRRRKKGAPDVDAKRRIRIYEDALRNLGVNPEELVRKDFFNEQISENVSAIDGFLEPRMPGTLRKTNLPAEIGVLVVEEGRTRYLENGIWTALKGEFREPREILDESSDEEFLEDSNGTSLTPYKADGGGLMFGSPISPSSLRLLHPSPVQIFKLWQLYLENINPLVKLFHAPTVQQVISDASGNLDDIPRNVEALLFAMYCVTTESLSDGECVTILGEPKSVCTPRFRSGAQHALVNISFLRTSDIMVLQAFTLFILSLQNYDARVIWMFSGMAQRIGQRIGLHRDGDKLGLQPFETEMRRRLWWQIMMTEGLTQKLAGVGSTGTILMGDVKMPLNINDSDLFPGMKEPPRELEGATEMMFFLIRCLVGEFLKRSSDSQTTFDGIWNRLSTSAVQVAVKDKAIDELEGLFQHKYLQYCDPSITWHLMCTLLARAIIFMMKFMAHSTEYYKTDLAQSEKDDLFTLALQVCTSQNVAYTMREMQGYMWHVNMHFQWKALIFLLSELRYRAEGEQVDQAWKEIEKTYEVHPSFDKELSKRALPVAVSNLTLKAWEAYIKSRGVPKQGEPYFIQLIRRRQNHTKNSNGSTHPLGATARSTSATQTSQDNGSFVNNTALSVPELSEAFNWDPIEVNDSLELEPAISDMLPLQFPDDMNWESWDDLLVDFQTSSGYAFPANTSTFNFDT